MSKKPSPKRARAKQKRLSPDDRRKEFVAKATEFFSEEGFGGGTRDLARRLGVTQPLLYRYFPSKDDLIKEVYRTVYLEPLDTGWEKLLADRSRPIRDRLQEFYKAYTNVIFTRKWLRIYLYSFRAGNGLGLPQRNLLLRCAQIHLRVAGARRQGADDQRRAGCVSGRL
jgi:AcrR family transcriptional regulator